MKLSKLYCNQPDFKKIKFNLTGLNVVYADVKSMPEEKKNSHDLGKTKLAEIIDFMLLKKVNKKSHFLFKVKDDKKCSIFADYVFFMEIMLNDGSYLTIKRGVENNSKISFYHCNSREEAFVTDFDWTYENIPITKAVDILNDYLNFDFFKNKDYNYRKSLGYSLRVQGDYGDVYKLSKYASSSDRDWKPFVFDLLGFDGRLLRNKYESDKKIEHIARMIKDIEEEGAVKVKDRDKLVAEKEEIERENNKLEEKIDRFNFYDKDKKLMNEGADEIEEEISVLNTSSYGLMSDLERLRKSLKNNFSFDVNKVKKVFEESKIYFPEQLKADYTNLIDFNKKLTEGRNKLIKEVIGKKEKELQDVNRKLKNLNDRREEILSYLTDTDAFAKFKYLQKELAGEQRRLTDIRNKISAIDDVIEKEKEIRRRREEIKKTVDKLEDVCTKTEKNEKYTRIRKKFIEYYKLVMDEFATISISLNGNDNVVFNPPEVRSRKDNSKSSAKNDGYTYKKILCVVFDLAILVSYNKESYFRFVYHDDVLSQQDNGIKVRMLGLINDVLKEYDIQYILSVIKSDLPTEGYGKTVNFDDNQIVLRLSDKDPSGTLFGFEF